MQDEKIKDIRIKTQVPKSKEVLAKLSFGMYAQLHFAGKAERQVKEQDQVLLHIRLFLLIHLNVDAGYIGKNNGKSSNFLVQR